jgi:hypothetical protein
MQTWIAFLLGKRALAAIALAAALACFSILANAQDIPTSAVKAIDLQVEWADGTPGESTAAEVKDAIQRTLQLAILEQLGASLPRLEANLDQITSTLQTVLDLVLGKRGMSLEDIEITPGETTLVKLSIALSGDKLEDVAVEFHFRSDTPLLAAVTKQDCDAIGAALTAKLSGTPLSDPAWVEKLAIREVGAELAARAEYSDFSPLVLVIPDTTTRIVVTLMPRENALVIDRYFVKLRSATMLNLALADVGGFVAANLESLRGLPIPFVKAKKTAIAGYLEKTTVFAPELDVIAPEAMAEIYVVEKDISLVFDVESRRFRVSASGRVDFNRPEYGARLDFTAGVLVSPSSDVWVHGTFFPGEFELRPQVGIGFRYEDRAFAEFGYDFKMNSPILRGQLNVLPDFYLSAEHYTEGALKNENEYGITYIFRNIYELKLITDFRDEIFASVGVRL